jgi:hypothetical protein
MEILEISSMPDFSKGIALGIVIMVVLRWVKRVTRAF